MFKKGDKGSKGSAPPPASPPGTLPPRPGAGPGNAGIPRTGTLPPRPPVNPGGNGVPSGKPGAAPSRPHEGPPADGHRHGRGGGAPVQQQPPAQVPSAPSASSLPAAVGARQRLGELLIQRQLVTNTQLQETLLQQSASGKRLGALLMEMGFIDERSLTGVLAEQLRIPIADLRTVTPEPEALRMLPEAVARGIGAIPLRLSENGLEVAVADVSAEVHAELTKAAGVRVGLLLAPASEVRRAIDNSYRALSGVQTEIEAFKATELARRVDTPTLQQAVADDAPVVKVVNLMITQGLRDRASDIHIEPQEDRLRVRYRIDGALHDVLALPPTMGPAVVSRLKIMASMNIVERHKSQDGQIAMNIDGRQVDIRVATTATIWGEKAVLRLLDKSKQLYRLGDLGMDPEVTADYSRLLRSPFGMLICTGPTGSGKTTTLYASLNEVNNSERNIMTIEDPVEYIFPSINQIAIREQAGVTFANGLKAILRQDPDVILVGEIRDAETARIAVQSALTGHLVMSSLHATDAAAALHRFLDMGIESFLISSSVIGVIGQRLLRRICPVCKVPYELSPDELAFYEQAGGPPKAQFWHGEGCNFCSKTGYQERIGAYELLRVTDEIKNLIVKDGSHEELRSMAISQGMRPLRTEALRLVYQDITTVSEVMRSIYTL